MEKLIPKYYNGRLVRNSIKSNTSRKPIEQDNYKTTYDYTDNQGYSGKYTEYTGGEMRGFESVHKDRLVTDPYGNRYNEGISLYWMNGSPNGADTIYTYMGPNGLRIYIKKGSKQYNWLRENSRGRNHKSLWREFMSLFGFKNGGRLVSKYLSGDIINNPVSVVPKTFMIFPKGVTINDSILKALELELYKEIAKEISEASKKREQLKNREIITHNVNFMTPLPKIYTRPRNELIYRVEPVWLTDRWNTIRTK